MSKGLPPNCNGIWIPDFILQLQTLDAIDMIIMSRISFFNVEGCWASIESYEPFTHVGRRVIQIHFQDLLLKGWIYDQENGSNRHRFYLNMKKIRQVLKLDPIAPRGAKSAPQGRKISAPDHDLEIEERLI